MQVILNPYQWDFLASSARFPGAVCGWGTGKTMLGITKGALLSSAYKGNLGMVVRKVYKDLEQSTIQDWNGLVPQASVVSSTRTATFRNGSRVFFRHLDELVGSAAKKTLQNINLGWFYIEQAEELDTGEQFDALRGRMRRKLVLDEGYFDGLARADASFASSQVCLSCESPEFEEIDLGGEIGVICRCRNCAPEGEEFGFSWPRRRHPRFRGLLDYMRTPHEVEVEGEVREVFGLRQGMVIANANGKNWVWRRWLSQNREDFPCIEATTFDNAHNLPADFVKDMRALETGTEAEQRKFRRYVMNCHDEMDLEGAYWLAQVNVARKGGRIGLGVGFEPDKSIAVHTAWDLGIGDSTAIWWFQKVGDECRVLKYYENNNEPIAHYIREIHRTRDELQIVYGKHFWPHDGKNKNLATGKELQKTAGEMGLKVTRLVREKKLEDGHERVRKLLPYCKFHEERCSLGIACLENYQRRKNLKMSTEEKPVFSDTPLENDSIHGADAFRYVSAGWRKLGGGMSKDKVRELARKYA